MLSFGPDAHVTCKFIFQQREGDRWLDIFPLYICQPKSHGTSSSMPTFICQVPSAFFWFSVHLVFYLFHAGVASLKYLHHSLINLFHILYSSIRASFFDSILCFCLLFICSVYYSFSTAHHCIIDSHSSLDACWLLPQSNAHSE